MKLETISFRLDSLKLICRQREADADRVDGTFGGAEAAFFAEVGGDACDVVLEGYCARGTDIDAVSAGSAFFFFNYGYHQITIPRR